MALHIDKVVSTSGHFFLHSSYSTIRQFAAQNVMLDPIFLASPTFQKFPHHLKTDLLSDTLINWFINEANKQDPILAFHIDEIMRHCV
jgi:hypothetical protein